MHWSTCRPYNRCVMPIAKNWLPRIGVGLSFVVAIVFAQTSAQTPAAPAKPVFVDGQAQVVPAFSTSSEWIHESLWVETEFDSDHDGKRDRVHVDVTRPKQTD